MRITNIHIKHFGGLHGLDLKLSDGVNVVFGGNESGKSTIAAFVKFVLFGFANKEEREHLLSMNGHDSVSGWLVVEAGESFRIERDCGTSGSEHTQVVALKNGAIVSKSKEPGVKLLGITPQLFTKSSYISQTDGAIPDKNGLGAAIENLLFSADESINTHKALDKLDKARVYLQHKNRQGGKISELESQLSNEKQTLAGAFETNLKLAEVSAKLDDSRQKLENVNQKARLLTRKLNGVKAFAQLKILRDIHKLSDSANNETVQLDQLRQSYSYNGFFPNAKYLDELKRLSNERNILISDNFSPASNSVPENFNGVPKTPVSGIDNDLEDMENKAIRYDALGGKGGIVEKYRIRLKNQIKSKYLSISALIAFFAFLAVGIVLYSLDSQPVLPIVFGVLAMIALILFIIFYRSSRIYLRNLTNFLSEFEVIDESGLIESLNGFYSRLDRLRRSKVEDAARETAKINLERENEQRNSVRIAQKDVQIKRLLDLYGYSDLELAIRDITARRDEINEKTARLQSLDARLNQLMELARASGNISDEILFSKDYYQKLMSDLEDSSLTDAELEAYTESGSNSAAELAREADFTEKAAQSLASRVHELETEAAVLQSQAVEAAPIADHIAEIESDLDASKESFAAITLAIEKLSAASEGLRSGISPRLSHDAGELLNIATSGKYKDMGVSSDFSVTYNNEGATLPDDFMSAGTKDVAYFCLRLALMNLICREEKPPLMCDEAFSRLDDERLTSVLRLLVGLASGGIQSIVFTCQRREIDTLKRICGEKIYGLHNIIEL